MDGEPNFLQLADAVLHAPNLDDAGRLFALLALNNLQAAQGLRELLAVAVPETTPLWDKILAAAKERQSQTAPKRFRWTDKDGAQTADAADRFLREQARR